MNDMSQNPKSLMHQEIMEIPSALERMFSRSSSAIEEAAEQARQSSPSLLVTIARGSSDHCATYLKYGFEIHAGLPVASLGPSVASIYRRNLKLTNAMTLAISQSGKSPDIIQATQMCRSNGALALSITNDIHSPLAEACDHAFDIAAGPEQSVAATKTFVNSLAVGLLFLGYFTRDDELLKAVRELPRQCEQAVKADWKPLLDYLENRNSLYVLGRGPAYAIAREMALKFKETCQIHAEAFSAAEVMHGPVSIVGKGFPVLALVSEDLSRQSVLSSLSAVENNGGTVFSIATRQSVGTQLELPPSGHPLTEPLVAIAGFYGFVEALAARRGNNPDLPPNLRKVTQTL